MSDSSSLAPCSDFGFDVVDDVFGVFGTSISRPPRPPRLSKGKTPKAERTEIWLKREAESYKSKSLLTDDELYEKKCESRRLRLQRECDKLNAEAGQNIYKAGRYSIYVDY